MNFLACILLLAGATSCRGDTLRNFTDSHANLINLTLYGLSFIMIIAGLYSAIVACATRNKCCCSCKLDGSYKPKEIASMPQCQLMLEPQNLENNSCDSLSEISLAIDLESRSEIVDGLFLASVPTINISDA